MMKETLHEIKSELTEAYSLLSMIAVSGDNVDRLAEARERLRKAFHAAKERAAELEAKEANGANGAGSGNGGGHG